MNRMPLYCVLLLLFLQSVLFCQGSQSTGEGINELHEGEAQHGRFPGKVIHNNTTHLLRTGANAINTETALLSQSSYQASSRASAKGLVVTGNNYVKLWYGKQQVVAKPAMQPSACGLQYRGLGKERVFFLGIAFNIKFNSNGYTNCFLPLRHSKKVAFVETLV